MNKLILHKKFKERTYINVGFCNWVLVDKYYVIFLNFKWCYKIKKVKQRKII